VPVLASFAVCPDTSLNLPPAILDWSQASRTVRPPSTAAALLAEFRYLLVTFPRSTHGFNDSGLALSLLFPARMNTSSSIITQELCIKGELAETYEGPGLPVGRIHINSAQLDVPMCVLNDAHLGDEIVLEVAVVVKRVLSHAGHDGGGHHD
jgi:hypothetical protein